MGRCPIRAFRVYERSKAEKKKKGFERNLIFLMWIEMYHHSIRIVNSCLATMAQV